jgi:nucleotide-binding universal stress UspA family protein
MTATDPLLAEAAAMDTSAAQFTRSTIDALRAFYEQAIDRDRTWPSHARVTFEASIGKPAPAILRAARHMNADLIVISSHGVTGFRKMFFGSTTERVLRETPVPMLVVPGNDAGPRSREEAARRVGRVLAPVLLPPPSQRQINAAVTVAGALSAPALLLHVVEPLRGVLPQTDRYLAVVERERRQRAEHELEQVAAALGSSRVEPLIAFGEPAEEIVKVARDRNAGLIVMALYASPDGGARIGSVTYRVLCAAVCPLLAVPPKPRKISRRAKKAAVARKARSPRSAALLSKSSKTALGTARALRGADTRFDT